MHRRSGAAAVSGPCVVLMPGEREPYLSMADRLARAVRACGCAVEILPGENPGEHPCQAKRWAVARGFAAGADAVYYIDADCEVVDVGRLGAFLAAPRSRGAIHVQRFYPVARFLRQLRVGRTKPHLDLWKALVREVCRGVEPVHMCDWLLCYALSAEQWAELLEVWDYVADRLRVAGLNWSDGVSIGIAAAAVGIPVVKTLSIPDVEGALRHLQRTTSVDPNWFATWKVPR